MKTCLKTLALAWLSAGLLTVAWAQGGTPSQPTDPTAQAPTTPPQSTPPTFPEPAPTAKPDAQASPKTDSATTTPDGARAFAGSITRQHDSFVLKAGNTFYKLDDQSQAKQFKGKNVQVTGSLDKSTNTIHVEKIEASSSM
jgi:hypothetical protein